MERCWAEDEHARPSFDEVLAELDDLRQCESAHSRLRGGDSQRWVCAFCIVSRHGARRSMHAMKGPRTPSFWFVAREVPLITSVEVESLVAARGLIYIAYRCKSTQKVHQHVCQQDGGRCALLCRDVLHLCCSL
jgi:hypothetical protein